MATYPLKNIAIGGNTYQIQSGTKSYRVVLSADLQTSSSIGNMTWSEMFETFKSSITWSVLGIYELGPGGQSYDPTQVMIDDLEGMKYYQAEFTFVGGDLNRYGSLASWSPEDETACQPTFIIPDMDNNVIGSIVTVSVDTTTNSVSNMILGAFGGGGGSNICLTLKTTNGGNMTFNQCAENTSFKLYDSSTNTAKTFNEILAAYAAGIPIIIKDNSPEYTTINFVSGNQQWINFTYMTGPWSSTMYSLACGASGNTFTVNGKRQVF